MNISVKSEYALLAVFDLSLQPPGEPVKIADVARRQKIPQKFLELILAGLKQGGFVESRRGAEGGYRLAKPANEITVGEVLRFVEDNKQTKRVADGTHRERFLGVVRAGDHMHRNMACLGVALQLIKDPEAGMVWQVQIQKDCLGPVQQRRRRRVACRARNDALETHLVCQIPKDTGKCDVVLDDEDKPRICG